LSKAASGGGPVDRTDEVASRLTEVMAGGTSRSRLGTVRAFDAERGLGLVATESGAEFGFHCTAIVDGTRQVAVGSTVAFGLAAAPGGRYEAVGLTSVDGV